ncbi:hypothetical protein GCM10027290_44100 [Micromonospora sonneratiae]|jgi:hypothetical protein|uniref:YtxH-like protein n=1 Tax=Micromonospora sonneratiae TaxID=1184706 RepID=A0ABW3YA14_9ACTN
MRGKLWFIGGLAAGFVLGARAGRETYDKLLVKGRQVLDHPTVQEAAGVAQAQATRLYTEGRDKLSQTRLGEKLHVNGNSTASTAGTAGTAANGSSPAELTSVDTRH